MSIAPSVMEKEHKKKRRKGEDGDDEQSKKKRRKHNHLVAKASTGHGGKELHSHKVGDAVLPTTLTPDVEYFGRQDYQQTPVAAQSNNSLFQPREGAIATGPQPPRPNLPGHEKSHKKKDKRKHSQRAETTHENGKATVDASLTAVRSQDQEGIPSKKHRHKVAKAGTEDSHQQEGDITEGLNSGAHVFDDQEIPSKSKKKREALATGLALDKPQAQKSDTADDSRQHDAAAHDSKRIRRRKEKRSKHSAIDDNAGQNEVQLQGSKTATSTQPPVPISQNMETPRKKRKHEYVNDYEHQQKASYSTSSANPPIPISHSQEIQRKKKAKRKHISTDPEAVGSLRQSVEDPSHAPGLVPGQRLPNVNPDSPNGSPFHLQTFSLYLPLAPLSQLHPLEGLCAEHLSPLILTYYTPFRGVILSYHNPRLSNGPLASTNEGDNEMPLARSIDEYAAPFVWVTAEFLILKPKVGTLMEGWVNLQNEGHIGMVCWNLFNASVGRKRIPTGWKWVQGGWDVGLKGSKARGKGMKDRIQDPEMDDGDVDAESAEAENLGHFVDETGRKIEGALTFRVTRVEVSRTWDWEKGERSFISLEGSLLTYEEEERLREKAAQRRSQGIGSGMRARRGYEEYTILDVLRDGEEAEND